MNSKPTTTITTCRNTTGSSKESYFIKNTPAGLDGAQFLAVNRDGSIVYGLKVKVQISLVELPEQAPEVVTEAVEKTICKYHVASGDSRTFQLDDDSDVILLTRTLEVYVLTDDLLVLLAYEVDKFQFCQTVIHLEKSKGWAQTVAVRRKTLSRVSGSPIVNLSFLDKGRVLLCGARATEEGRTERMTLSIAADPMRAWERVDEDLSSLIEDFNKFLISRPPESDGNRQLVSLFLLHLDEEKISIVLSETMVDESEPVLSTSAIGVIDRKKNLFSVEKVDNTALKAHEPLRVTSIANVKVKNGSVWMSFSVMDVAKLQSLYWRLKHLYVRIMLRLMILGFHASLYLWRFDNGFCFNVLTRVLMFLHGPTMIPVYAPEKTFCLCYLDMKRRQFFRFEHAARVLKNRRDPNDTDFALNFDVDSSGGAVVVDFPTGEQNQKQMSLSYYPNPTIPKSLARMCSYTAYRKFPSFEKSSLLRRLTGMFDWKWTV